MTTTAARSDLGFQGHYLPPPATASDATAADPAAAILVGTPHNSSKAVKNGPPGTLCPNARWAEGTCVLHEQRRWVLVACKGRNCDICGPLGRHHIAKRIALGIDTFKPAAWMVLTFRTDITKRAAVRRVGAFVKALRARPGMASLQYVVTWELTKNGRLHANLICGPWQWTPANYLRHLWRARLSVRFVRNDRAMAREASKDLPAPSLDDYVIKADQVVPEDRRVSFSKGWPKLPPPGPRQGVIRWRRVDFADLADLDDARASGDLVEVAPGEYMDLVTRQYQLPCTCYHQPGDHGPPGGGAGTPPAPGPAAGTPP